MPNPLNREWLPDSGRMRSTTAWILQREPLMVRIAPPVILLFVVGLAAWAASARVAVYESIPGRVSAAPATPSHTFLVHLDDGAALLKPGSRVTVLPANEPPARGVAASVVEVTRAGETDGFVVSLAVDEGASEMAPGPVVVRVESGQRTLLAEFFAAAGGRKKAS